MIYVIVIQFVFYTQFILLLLDSVVAGHDVVGRNVPGIRFDFGWKNNISARRSLEAFWIATENSQVNHKEECGHLRTCTLPQALWVLIDIPCPSRYLNRLVPRAECIRLRVCLR